MKNIKILKRILVTSAVILSVSCTNLEESVLDGVSVDAPVDVTSLLANTYTGTWAFQGQGQFFALDEMSTDALVGPTRGGDWDDNGLWRSIHLHNWTPDHGEIRGAWNSLLSQVNNCNVIIEKGTPAQVAEARYLRAFFYYHVIDLFGQVPFRVEGSSKGAFPTILSRADATTFVISELEAILPTLGDRNASDASMASKDAAHFLLAKLYLNKSVFAAANTAGPYTFDAADMTKVVSHVDMITNQLESDYWKNFTPDNNLSKEIVFSSKNTVGQDNGAIRTRWYMSAHYNQNPSGWNGFSTMAEYYDRFNTLDNRINHKSAIVTEKSGYNLGFQIGQQFGPGGITPLNDRNGNPLFFTKEITIITGGLTLETAGIRGQKYQPDYSNIDKPNNDYVLFRYSDALLMKAEAIARGGSGAVGTIMTDLAARAGVTAAAADLAGIYAERGRELWWEGWRRNDMIRFGKFLEARELKATVSDPKFLLYPIPTAALYNPNF